MINSTESCLFLGGLPETQRTDFITPPIGGKCDAKGWIVRAVTKV